MGSTTNKPQQDPAEGSRETIERQLKQTENKRESGARKLEERRDASEQPTQTRDGQ